MIAKIISAFFILFLSGILYAQTNEEMYRGILQLGEMYERDGQYGQACLTYYMHYMTKPYIVNNPKWREEIAKRGRRACSKAGIPQSFN